MEGTAKLQSNLFKEALKDNLLPLLIPVKKALKPVGDLLNPDKTNASYLLGVNGVVTIGHGSSNQRAIKNGIKYTARAIDKEFISKFTNSIHQS